MVERKNATMQQVADAVGVSVSTVSRVFNRSEFATQETRDRVIKAAARMRYTPSRRAVAPRSLGSFADVRADMQTLGNIVLLVPEPLLDTLRSSDWIYRDVVPTVQRMARANGFNLILSSYGRDDEWNADAINAKQVGGVLWMAHDRQDLLARIAQSVPVVVINDNTIWPPQTCVMSCNRMVLFKAVEHLVSLGHRRIGYFDVDERPSKPSIHCGQRLGYYHEAIAHFGLDADPSLHLRERFGFNEHPQAVARAMDCMDAMASRPTALISPLIYSIQFLKEARKRSIDVPRDLSLVAIDNAAAADMVDPSLTTIDCMFGRCAEVAVELLMSARKSQQPGARSILMEPKLIVRSSTARHGDRSAEQ